MRRCDGAEHQTVDAVGMAHRHLEGHEPAPAEPEHVGALEAEVVEHADDVGGLVGEGDVTVDVGGATVALELDRDDAPVRGSGAA